MTDPRSEIVRDVSGAAARSAWPVGATVYGAISSSLPTLVGLATLFFIVLQSAHLVWKWRREARSRPAPGGVA